MDFNKEISLGTNRIYPNGKRVSRNNHNVYAHKKMSQNAWWKKLDLKRGINNSTCIVIYLKAPRYKISKDI